LALTKPRGMLRRNATVKPFLVSLVEPVAYLKSELAGNLLLAWQGHLLASNRLPADAEQRGFAPAPYVHRGHQSWGENHHVRRETLRRPLPRQQQLVTLVYFCLVVFSQSSKLALGEVPGASRCPAGLYFFFCSSFRRAVIRSTVLSLMARNWFTRSTGDRVSALNILMICSCRLQRTPFNSDCCFSSRSNNLASDLTRSSMLGVLY